MKKETLTIKVKKLMDITDAAITLNGITVITPGTTSDRQLLLKFIYYLLHHIIHYRKDVEKKLFNEEGLDKTYRHLRKIVKNFDPEENPIVYLGNEEYLYTLEREQEWIATIRRIEKLSPASPKNNPETTRVFEHMQQTVHQQFSEAKELLRERPVSFLMQSLFGIYPEKWELPDFEVWEGNTRIITPRQQQVESLQSIRKIIYLCPPLFPNPKDSLLAGKWYQFSKLLQEELNKSDNKKMHTKLRNRMKGEIIPHPSARFIYKRETENK